MRMQADVCMHRMSVSHRSKGAFTLIELLVAIAIIALLISVIMPSIGAARKHGMAVKCSANLHHVGQAMGAYLADNVGIYPPAYIYPYDAEGNYDLTNQPGDHPYGYIHWSWFLYSKGQAPEDAFKCPSMLNGGIRRWATAAPWTSRRPRDTLNPVSTERGEDQLQSPGGDTG